MLTETLHDVGARCVYNCPLLTPAPLPPRVRSAVHLNQNVRVQESRAGFSGSVSIPSITKNRAEPGRSMSASSGLGIREYPSVLTHQSSVVDSPPPASRLLLHDSSSLQARLPRTAALCAGSCPEGATGPNGRP